MLKVREIYKYFGRVSVLSGVDLEIGNGEFITLFGQNGAGKTTLLRIIANLTKPDSGEVLVNNNKISDNLENFRKIIGFVSHNTFLYKSLSAEENLRLFGELYDIENLNERVKNVLNMVGLQKRNSEPIRNYSRGMLQRLAIARGIIHNPSILLFDEPYTGLDIEAINITNEMFSDFKNRGISAIVTTHDIERGLKISDYITILNKGKIVYKEKRGNINPDNFEKIYNDFSLKI